MGITVSAALRKGAVVIFGSLAATYGRHPVVGGALNGSAWEVPRSKVMRCHHVDHHI
jgi:hypothetical protein